MEPRIQYAKASDGVDIAYAVLGSGPVIVFPSNIWGSIHLYKNEIVDHLKMFDRLVSLGWSIVTYDGRGCGSSDRNVEDYTIEAKLRDLEAVIARAAPERFAMCGTGHGGPAAIAYTVQQPRRVTQLILANTFAQGQEWEETVPAMRASKDMMALAKDDWDFFTLTLASGITAHQDADLARKFADAFRLGMTAEDYVAFRAAVKDIDLREMLPQIAAPTLVVHDRSFAATKVGDVVQRLARLIPHARFVETGDLATVADEFLQEGGLVPTPLPPSAIPAETRPDASAPSGTAVILFADIVDSTALTERLGDDAFRKRARGLDEAMRAAISDNGGTAVEGKTLGDGVLAVFTSAKQAIACAQACHDAASAAGLALHAGIHAGDVIREADNVYGGAVNIAARVAAASAAGETLVSGTVRELARTSAGVVFEDRGEQALKGIEDPVRVWAVKEA